jgi:predicted nucleic acid-binding protein
MAKEYVNRGAIFLDTSGLLAAAHKPEAFHQLASQLFRDSQKAITQSYVLAEFLALAFVRGLPRLKVIEFADALYKSQDVHITWVGEKLHQQAMQLLRTRIDKGYTLCDAVSFVLMRSVGVQNALTTDKHFVQEGFVRLLE